MFRHHADDDNETLRATRIATNWRVYVVQDQTRKLVGKATNISVSGLRVETPYRIAVQTRLEIEIEVSRAYIIRPRVHVTREEALGPGRFAYGCRVLRMADGDREILGAALLRLRRGASQDGAAA